MRYLPPETYNLDALISEAKADMFERECAYHRRRQIIWPLAFALALVVVVLFIVVPTVRPNIAVWIIPAAFGLTYWVTVVLLNRRLRRLARRTSENPRELRNAVQVILKRQSGTMFNEVSVASRRAAFLLCDGQRDQTVSSRIAMPAYRALMEMPELVQVAWTKHRAEIMQALTARGIS